MFHHFHYGGVVYDENDGDVAALLPFPSSSFSGLGSKALIEASIRPFSSILIILTVTVPPTLTTSSTCSVRSQASSEMWMRASVLLKRWTKAPNFSIRTTGTV